MVAANENSLDDDRDSYNKWSKKAVKKDDTWYVISNEWYNNWSRYARVPIKDKDDIFDDEGKHPGHIDNSAILSNSGQLNTDSLEDDDFTLIPEEFYRFLKRKYNIISEKHELPRKVIELNGARKNIFIEVFPLQLTFRVPQRAETKPFVMEFSKADSGFDVLQKVKDHLKSQNLQLHVELDKGQFEKLTPTTPLHEVCGKPNMTVEIEFPDNDGKWSRDNKGRRENGAAGGIASSSSAYGSSSSTYSYQKSRTYISHPGIRGLNNLGNTCFMNSAIQSLSNVPSLTAYFRRSNWKTEINYDNPLGMRGEIALSYAELIDSLWCENGSSTFMPRRFKMAVGKFAPQFCGFQQQDAQELMAFLLDGLHEDLNRIKKKPYIEMKDYDEALPDKEIADDSWKNYLKRNDSIIVDLFHGQLRSELHCPECQRHSITFDPFCYLSLPLPNEEVPVTITVYPAGRSGRSQHQHQPAPVKYTLRMGIDVTLKEALRRLRETSGYQESQFILSECKPGHSSRNFPPSYKTEISTTSFLDNNTTVRHNFYALELKDCPSDQSYSYHVRVDFLDEGKGVSKCRPWVVNVDKSYEKATIDARKKLIFDALLKDEYFVSFFPALPVNNNSCEMDKDIGVNNDAQEDEPMQVDEKNELEKHFSLDLRHFSTTHLYFDIVEAKLRVDAPPGFFEVLDDTSVSSSKSVGRGVYLRNCLDLFTKKERLGERDSWYCNKCKKHQRATKKFDLWKLPETLVIHIKRFGNANRLWRNKLNTKVFFPLENLDMSPWVKKKGDHNKYNLVSVVNHYGSMGGGHYTAFGRNKDDKQWYNFDDSSVTVTSPESVVTQNAYVLVYVRNHSPPPPSPPPPAPTADLMEAD